MFEKDIISINMSKSMSQMVNEVSFWNGLPSSDGSYIAKKYSNSASQLKYGRWAETKNDSRYKITSSADDAMARYINNFKDPVNTVEMEIADNNFGLGYDIESIKPGQTCKVRNISANNALSGNMLITSVEYKFSSVKIVVADVRTFLERSIFELAKKQQAGDYITDSPNSYS
jgi:hypothetical protein